MARYSVARPDDTMRAMTIFACCVVPEGVALAADSMSTVTVPSGDKQFTHEQKIYEVGHNGTLGIANCGLGTLGPVSQRTIVAEFADELENSSHKSMAEVASAWSQKAWSIYSANVGGMLSASDVEILRSKASSDALIHETKQRVIEYAAIIFGVVGRYGSRAPKAYKVVVHPFLDAPPEAIEIPKFDLLGARGPGTRFLGKDIALLETIYASDKWNGSKDELRAVFEALAPPLILPISMRDAIDLVYSLVFTTIKSMKFTSQVPTCGGPVEVAVISTDRPFRWVRHKALDSAIGDADEIDVVD
jgi:hypothetical protein